MLRTPGMTSDDVCWTAALDVLMLPCFDHLLLYTRHTHIHRDYWHKGESLEHGCSCIAAAVLLYTGFVDARLSGCFCRKKNTAS